MAAGKGGEEEEEVWQCHGGSFVGGWMLFGCWLAGESKLGKRSVVGERKESGSIVRRLCMDSRNGAAKGEGG